MKRLLVTTLAAALVTQMLAASPALGTPGELDNTFGTGGKVMTTVGSSTDVAQALTLQEDGKLLAAGFSDSSGSGRDVALVRYEADGSLDATFGNAGKVVSTIGTATDTAQEVLVQPDGKIVVGGGAFAGFNCDSAVLRYTPEGQLDTAFDRDGRAVADISFCDYINDMVLLPDGDVVTAGNAWGESNFDFSLLRFTPSGALDSAFGNGGVVTTDVGAGEDRANAIALWEDSKVVVAGYSIKSSKEFAVARYSPNGALDTSFSGDGKRGVDIGPFDDEVTDVAIQPDGKIVLAGYTQNSAGDRDFALLRLAADGSNDPTFGQDGLVIVPGAQSDTAQAVVVLPGGKILVAGESAVGSNSSFKVVRVGANGSPDGTFGTGGEIVTAFGPGIDRVFAAVVQPDGNPVLAGEASNGANADFALARYEGDPPEEEPGEEKDLTTTSLRISKSARRLRISGDVMPAHESKTVTVSLARRKAGRYMVIATKQPLLDSMSSYRTAFKRPRSGRCRFVATFAEDDDHLASRAVKRFSC